MNRIATVAAALALCAFTGTASANERPTELMAATMKAVGHAIANQGNAALIQIRNELKDSAIEHIRQYMTLPKPVATATPAPAVSARR